MANSKIPLPFKVTHDPLDNFGPESTLLKKDLEQALELKVLPTGFTVSTPGGTILEVVDGYQDGVVSSHGHSRLVKVVIMESDGNQPAKTVRVPVVLDDVLKEDKSVECEKEKSKAASSRKPKRDFNLTADAPKPSADEPKTLGAGRKRGRAIVVGGNRGRAIYSNDAVAGTYAYID